MGPLGYVPEDYVASTMAAEEFASGLNSRISNRKGGVFLSIQCPLKHMGGRSNPLSDGGPICIVKHPSSARQHQRGVGQPRGACPPQGPCGSFLRAVAWGPCGWPGGDGACGHRGHVTRQRQPPRLQARPVRQPL